MKCFFGVELGLKYAMTCMSCQIAFAKTWPFDSGLEASVFGLRLPPDDEPPDDEKRRRQTCKNMEWHGNLKSGWVVQIYIYIYIYLHISYVYLLCFNMFQRNTWDTAFFPRASERRVLPIVGVCKTPSHLLILTSSPHLLIFTSSHLHIFSSSHLLIFTSSYLLIFSSSHLLTSSHLHIFSSHIFSSCRLALLPSCPSCPLLLFYLLKAGAGAVPTRRHETKYFRTKRGSIAKN